MSDKDIRPTAMMRYMEEDEQAVSSISKTARRVKIEMNHTWNIRLLPVQMGPEKMPYVRLAQHWWNKSPVTCPTWTPKGFGGNPDCVCPICELSERLNESSSKEIRDIGYSARCVLRFRFWCVVFDTEDARNNIDELPMEEILNPYEFDMYKTTWEDFKKYQKWATTRRKEVSEWGVLDLETGCNMLATHGAKGTRLDRQDPAPIFDLKDPNFDKYIEKIWNKLRKPQIIIPTERQLLETAVKIEEYSEDGGSRRPRRGRDDGDDRGRGRGRDRRDDPADDAQDDRGRSRYTGEDDDQAPSPRRRQAPDRAEDSGGGSQEDAPPARSRRAAPAPDSDPQEPETPPRRASASAPPPARRSAPPQEPEPEQAEQPQEEQAPPPARRAAASAPPPARRQAAPQNGDEKPTGEDLDQDQSPNPAPPPPARRAAAPAAPTAPPPARRATPQTEASGEEDAGDTAPQRPPARRAAAPPPQEPGMAEDEDTVAEEARDPAPPVREKVEDVPPPVAATSPAPKRANASDLQSRLAKLNEKGK